MADVDGVCAAALAAGAEGRPVRSHGDDRLGCPEECLAEPRVEAVLSIGRRRTPVDHRKLRQIVKPDPFDLSDVLSELAGYRSCFFCTGVSSVGLDEAVYARITHDGTIAVAETLASVGSPLTFCYVSGQGTDSTERGRRMWARVKGRTENRLFEMPIDAYAFRPGFVRPAPGIRSKTPLYNASYAVMGPFFPLLRRFFPRHVTTTTNMGRAMIRVCLEGYPERVLENEDMNRLAEG